MAVAAKMYLAEEKKYAGRSGNKEVVLRAVTRGTENKTWCSATPNGTLSLNISNPAAAEFFDVDDEVDYLITIEKVQRYTFDDGHGYEDAEGYCRLCGTNEAAHPGTDAYKELHPEA